MMEAAEAKTIISSLKKAEDTQTILQLLHVLQDKVVPSEQFLRKTKVGVAVNRLRSNTDPEVHSLVVKIIKHWKDVVFKEKRNKRHALQKSKIPAKGTTVKVKQEIKSEANNTTSATTVKHEFVSSKRRNPANDGVKVDIYGDTTRNGSISALYTALAIESTAVPTDILKVARQIELCTYDLYAKKVDAKYRTKMRSLIMNLRNKKNPELRIKLVDGELEPSKFIKMTNHELAPESLKKVMADIHQKNLFDAQGAVQKRAVTDRFVCSKCHQREVSYYQMQTRSADEPLTTFCTCEKCGNHWKFC